jgi:integrase
MPVLTSSLRWARNRMASIRKRTWATGTAWVVDYIDAQGKRRLKTFARKKDADAWRARAQAAIAAGTHQPDHGSPTLADAAEQWLAAARARGLEPLTLRTSPASAP